MSSLTREEIIKSIVDVLKPLDFVYAMWQCGSAAFGRVDEWSDIDIVVDVEDDKTREIFKYIDAVLESLSGVENYFESSQPMSPGGYQKVYRLKNVSKFLVVEICAVMHSSTNKFLKKEIHGDVFVNFDKDKVTEVMPIDKREFAKKLDFRLKQIENLVKIYGILVEKELNRHNYIEAFAFYQNFTLNPLVEVLRIKHSPYRYNFRTRYVYYDFPKDIVKKLEELYFIKDGDDLKVKYEETKKWLNELIEEVKKINLEENLNKKNSL